MLFMYIHTHSPERCLADKPDQVRKIYAGFLEGAAKAGIKPVATYTAAHEHTVYSIFEASDLSALETVLTPMTVWGNARLIPIVAAGAI
jgi:muconolactone delta-isomerase